MDQKDGLLEGLFAWENSQWRWKPPQLVEQSLQSNIVKNGSQDSAIVWWYFETALWCWKTTEFYFNEVIRPKNGNDLEKNFKTTCEQATWREIADVRDRVNNASRTPIIFTMEFFRAGIRTLSNAIASYLSQDSSNGPLQKKFERSF